MSCSGSKRVCVLTVAKNQTSVVSTCTIKYSGLRAVKPQGGIALLSVVNAIRVITILRRSDVLAIPDLKTYTDIKEVGDDKR